MAADAEGFLYPRVDDAKCVNCGICAKVCPSLNQGVARHPLSVFAAKAKDEELRTQSSSGGVFSLLAHETLSNGGIVFGAAFDHNDWHIYHRGVDSEEELAELRGSKYVQSDMGDVFRQVGSTLLQGKEVLFTGTPCQIAGLRQYLSLSKVSADKLLTVDIICHAVPSPLAWRKYLSQRISHAYNADEHELSSISGISLRSKVTGWRKFSFSLSFANGADYSVSCNRDLFLRGFLAELYNRPSCQKCPDKGLRCGSDLSIGDFWGVDVTFPEMNDDRGISLILVNTEKGHRTLSNIMDNAVFRPTDFNHAILKNYAIVSSKKAHRNRHRFFARIESSDFDNLVASLLKPSLMMRVRSRLSKMFARR